MAGSQNQPGMIYHLTIGMMDHFGLTQTFTHGKKRCSGTIFILPVLFACETFA